MGLKHEAKKGTVIEVNGVTIKVLRGSPLLEITAPSEAAIMTGHITPATGSPLERQVGSGEDARESDGSECCLG